MALDLTEPENQARISPALPENHPDTLLVKTLLSICDMCFPMLGLRYPNDSPNG